MGHQGDPVNRRGGKDKASCYQCSVQPEPELRRQPRVRNGSVVRVRGQMLTNPD